MSSLLQYRTVFVGGGPAACGRHWYAIRVRSHSERATASILRIRGYEEFLPVNNRCRALEGQEAGRPLFPGYLFARFDLRERHEIQQIPRVVRIVGIGNTPVPVDNAEIATLQTIVASPVAAAPWPFLAAGDRVLIERGPLAGLEGILVATKNRYRVVVSVTLLQRSVSVEVDREWVRVISARFRADRLARLAPSYA